MGGLSNGELSNAFELEKRAVLSVDLEARGYRTSLPIEVSVRITVCKSPSSLRLHFLAGKEQRLCQECRKQLHLESGTCETMECPLKILQEDPRKSSISAVDNPSIRKGQLLGHKITCCWENPIGRIQQSQSKALSRAFLTDKSFNN